MFFCFIYNAGNIAWLDMSLIQIGVALCAIFIFKYLLIIHLTSLLANWQCATKYTTYPMIESICPRFCSSLDFKYNIFWVLFSVLLSWNCLLMQVESYLRIIGEPKLPSAFLQVRFSLSGFQLCCIYLVQVYIALGLLRVFVILLLVLSYRSFVGSWGNMELQMGNILPPISVASYVM